MILKKEHLNDLVIGYWNFFYFGAWDLIFFNAFKVLTIKIIV